MPQLSFHAPFDALTLTEEKGEIIALDVGWGAENEETPLLLEAKKQLLSYFSLERERFDLPLAPYGTDYQRRVFKEMQAIPYGQQRSYKKISDILQSSPRAVGQACGKNPIPILIPCHRIVASHGKIGGFGWGEDIKKYLLTLEGMDID